MPSSLNIQALVDPQDIDAFTAYYDTVGRKLSRAEMLPILKAGLDPMVASEKSFLAPHSKSGALGGSLQARAGSGDRPGTVSMFAAATATVKQIQATWGAKGRKQQRGWHGALKGKGRVKVFYADYVHKGHRIVKTRANGETYLAGKAAPVPFAQQAVDALGDAQAEKVARAVLDHILGD
jgi:hypothetical protein